MVRARWSKFTAVIAIVLASAACCSAVASAEGEEDTGGFGAFRLKGTNGYLITVFAFSKPHFKGGEVLVWAGNQRNAAVFYFVPATVTATTIEADLGPVGDLDVQFKPSGPPKRVYANCRRGGSVRFEPGAWVGSISIEGEEAFTRAMGSRSKAISSLFFGGGCGGYSIGETFGHDAHGARLVARSPARKRSLFLQVNQNHRNAPVLVETSLEERWPGMVIDRELLDRYPARAFAFDTALDSATLAPPAPFSGSATFHRNAKPANRWTGNLTLDFPGRADVPLAGSAFKTTLVPAKRTEEKTQYDRLLRPSLLPK